MKTIISILLLITLISCSSRATNFTVKDGILIESITIISTDETGTIEKYLGYILIDQSEIVFCGKEEPNVKGKLKIINGKGKYAIPGLIDSHVHLNNIAGINFRQRKANEELVNDYFDRLPRNFLYFGYTSLIDVDNYAPNTIERLRDIRIRPEIYTCAQKVQVMDDFEMVMNESPQNERYETPFLYDNYNENIKIPDSINLGLHTPSSLISQITQKDNICVKTLYEDAASGLPQVWEVPTLEIMNELVTEAHAKDLPVIMHATSYEGQLFAVNAGVDVIAHAMWNWTSNPEDYLNTNLPETHKELLLDISNKRIGYQPTFRVILAEKDILDNTFKDSPILKLLYTPRYIDWLQSEDAQWSRDKILARPKFLEKMNPEFFNPIRSQFNSDEEMIDKLYKSYELKIQKVVSLLAENNANLLFSTDNGAMNMYTHPPGYNGYLEMQHWFDAGVPLKQIFKAATYNNAKEFDLINSVGTLSIGKTANILILNSNPFETIEAYNDIQFVLMNGELIEREKLTSKYDGTN
ncbi:amidohydrolase family protein [Zobellia uliginosa]|uniref:amidohydrolase family protein n=1 Tax=Zobellia uliginosa TaxID=143224 RepID=UPI0026E35551|nr:amidohydrolase family protein [Zobellia uliginosa]MDO6518519.1 amidohydrolase family protein [Zobellia uliginosa]